MLASIRFRHPYKGPHLQVAAPHPSPSRSKLTRRARQALHRQTDASFRLHIGSPPPSSSALSVFLASFPYNFQPSALRRGNIYTTFPTNDALGAWSACNPGAPSRISHVHSFVHLFREHFAPDIVVPEIWRREGKERRFLSWKSLDHTVNFNLQTHTFASTQLDNMSQSSGPSWKLVLAALLASFSLATAHFEFQYPPWRGNTLKDDMQWKYPCTVANSLLFQRTWG